MLMSPSYHNQEELGGHSLKDLMEPNTDNGDYEENIVQTVDHCITPPGRLNGQKSVHKKT